MGDGPKSKAIFRYGQFWTMMINHGMGIMGGWGILCSDPNLISAFKYDPQKPAERGFHVTRLVKIWV